LKRKRRTPVWRALAAAVALAATAATAGLWLGWWSLNMFRARAYAVWGLDVSHHQGHIDWPRVARTPRIRFAYIKASERAARKLRDIWREPAGWQIWQFANRGRVDGITGYVDLNAFAGSVEALQR
jgi:GH25 family lysozyme M1 (1,4-beta-N-acetylmuramidase)